MSTLPKWLSAQLIVDVDIARNSQHMLNELANQSKIPIIYIDPYYAFMKIVSSVYGDNLIDLGEIEISKYNENLSVDKITESVMYGSTTDNYQFIVIKFDIEGELVIITFFEKDISWIVCEHDVQSFITYPLCDFSDQLKNLTAIISGRSIVMKNNLYPEMQKYIGKTLKLWKSEVVPDLISVNESDNLPDKQRIPEVDDVITFNTHFEEDEDAPVCRTISTYGQIVVTPTSVKYWRVTRVDPHGNGMNVKGSHVYNSNEENHGVQQVYIHVHPAELTDKLKDLRKNAKEFGEERNVQCFWFIDFTNGYIRQWEDSAITHSVYDLKIIPDFERLASD
jgi:hypothetical protein